MNFWDASAIVPLLVAEALTSQLMARLDAEGSLFVWWGTDIECASALARSEREGRLSGQQAQSAFQQLAILRDRWSEVEPVDMLREIARRLLRVHPLRAADASQLAAAILVAEQRPSTLGFVCLDHRLNDAARREGFEVIDRDVLRDATAC